MYCTSNPWGLLRLAPYMGQLWQRPSKTDMEALVASTAAKYFAAMEEMHRRATAI